MNANGKWDEIDNALSEKDGFISTNDSRIVFASQIIDGGHIYSINDGQYHISVSLPDAQIGGNAKIDNFNSNQKEKTKFERLTEVENMTSSIEYSCILPGADIKYTLFQTISKRTS